MTTTDTRRPAAGRLRLVRHRLALACLAAGVLFGGLLLYRGAPRAASAAGAQPAAARHRPIEALHVGDRVAAHNPEADDQARRAADPDPAAWRHLTLRVDRPGVCRFDVELLRPLAWLEAVGARVGGTVHLRLPEMGLDDPAAVLAIAPCPECKPGRGRVVTGTFRHLAEGNLLDVRVQGLAAPIGCTTAHPFWSEDRRAFVFAGELRSGERLRTAEGESRRVTAVEPRRGREYVYNIEVDAEHVYFVSALGLLVHNSSPNPPPPPPEQPPISPKLQKVLDKLVEVWGENPPRSIEEGQLAARSAANRAGLASEGAPRADSPPGQLILDNNSGVTTTIQADGSITVRLPDGTVVLELSH
jgi:hypothetical protein